MIEVKKGQKNFFIQTVCVNNFKEIFENNSDILETITKNLKSRSFNEITRQLIKEYNYYLLDIANKETSNNMTTEKLFKYMEDLCVKMNEITSKLHDDGIIDHENNIKIVKRMNDFLKLNKMLNEYKNSIYFKIPEGIKEILAIDKSKESFKQSISEII